MNKITIILIAAAAMIAGCSRHRVQGDGVIKTENRPISGFSKIEVTGGYQIKWSSGEPALSITTDENLLPLINTDVSGDTLQIDSNNNLAPTDSIAIIVSSASLADVKLIGGNSFKASRLSGPGLTLESIGASDITVDGSVAELEATLTGASKLNAKSLRTQTATLSLVGASDADVTVTEKLKASVTGAGSLTYSGNPKSVEQQVSGVGSIRHRP
jgi:hypothetical protein